MRRNGSTWAGGIHVFSENGQKPWTGLDIDPFRYQGLQMCREKGSSPNGWVPYSETLLGHLWMQLTPKAARQLLRDLSQMVRKLKK